MPIDEHPKTKRVRLPRATRWQADSEPSKAGADAAEPRARSQENRVLSWLKTAGRSGLTSDQLYDLFNAGIDQGDPLQRLLRTPKGSIRRAITMMAEKGLICAAAKTRPGVYGTRITVWIAMEFANPEEREAQEAKLNKRRQKRG